MSDLIKRLRALSAYEHSDFSIGNEAVAEIERLTARVAELEEVIALNCDPFAATEDHEIIIKESYKRFEAREDNYLAAKEKS